eukprot:scaffold4772_cov27-Tisochrysis_lutea.AAC.1
MAAALERAKHLPVLWEKVARPLERTGRVDGRSNRARAQRWLRRAPPPRVRLPTAAMRRAAGPPRALADRAQQVLTPEPDADGTVVSAGHQCRHGA